MSEIDLDEIRKRLRGMTVEPCKACDGNGGTHEDPGPWNDCDACCATGWDGHEDDIETLFERIKELEADILQRKVVDKLCAGMEEIDKLLIEEQRKKIAELEEHGKENYVTDYECPVCGDVIIRAKGHTNMQACAVFLAEKVKHLESHMKEKSR